MIRLSYLILYIVINRLPSAANQLIIFAHLGNLRVTSTLKLATNVSLTALVVAVSVAVALCHLIRDTLSSHMSHIARGRLCVSSPAYVSL